MLARRSLFAAVTLLTPLAGFTTPARAQGGKLFSFGVIADPQYAPVPPNLRNKRYYANSLWKMQDAIATLNGEELSFVVTLGDIIDRHWESFSHILPMYDTLRHRKAFVLGNHDFEVGADYLRSVVRTVGMPNAYYDFAGAGHRFVLIDGNDVTVFAPPAGDPRRALAAERLAALKARNAENAQPWNGSLGDAQIAWLKRTLDAARAANERVIVMGHYPVYPANIHNMWDAERIVALLGEYPNVAAYFCGHNHAGNYGETNGQHFVNFCGMVDTPDTTAYSIVEVYPDRLAIRGFGRESNRELRIRATS